MVRLPGIIHHSPLVAHNKLECCVPTDITIGLQADSYTVSEEDEVVTVCVEVIRGENERDVVVALSTLENGIAAGQSSVKFKHDTSYA